MRNEATTRTRAFLWLAGLLLLLCAGCGRLDSIPTEPPQTPESWLTIQPFVRVQLGPEAIVLVQPSSTVLVYLLGVVAIAAGLSIWRGRGSQRARAGWAVALVLWGAGALLAGTSYQAFSYELKCAGRTVCAWTSWWEVGYLVLSAASVDAMLLAGAYAYTTGRWRRALSLYAVLNAALYGTVVLVGALAPNKFLISFELLLLVAAPGVLILFALSVVRYYQQRRPMDLALLVTWLWLGLTLAAYFVYLVSGLTEELWARGVWFSENDVLHIGLILWMVYIGLVVGRRAVDAAEAAPGLAGVEPLEID
jgi:hypothetical protein